MSSIASKSLSSSAQAAAQKAQQQAAESAAQNLKLQANSQTVVQNSSQILAKRSDSGSSQQNQPGGINTQPSTNVQGTSTKPEENKILELTKKQVLEKVQL